MTSSNQPPDSIESALVRSLDAPGLDDLAGDIAEAGLDQLLSEGLLRDVPVLGTLIGLSKAIGVVRDRIFAKKVLRFLLGTRQIPYHQRKQFLDGVRLRGEDRRLGETLVLLIDRLDDFDTASLLSKLFRGHVQGRCDIDMFRRLAAVLDHVPVSAIGALRLFYSSNGSTTVPEFMAQFASVGVASIEFHFEGFGLTSGSYATTPLGHLFLSLIDASQ